MQRARFAEGAVSLSVPQGVFFNTQMSLCRSIFSLAVGALPEKLSVFDPMCASGARGIRYAKENSNVSSLALCDLSRKAVACARANAKANKVRCKVAYADACRYLYENEFDFVELDPFGSPIPFLHDAARSFRTKKAGYLSVTATDTAVLCGAHHAACIKNYGAVPLNNEFTHENAVRILAASVIRAHSPQNFQARPILTFSHRHYVKMLFGLEKSAKGAEAACKSLGFVSYCPKCCWRGSRRIPVGSSCPYCGAELAFGGQFYLGSLFEPELISKMLALNAKRALPDAKDVGKILTTIQSESIIQTLGYYDLHVLAKRHRTPIKSMDSALESLRRMGFAASRTHFSPTSIRTDAPHEAVIEMMKG